MPRKGSSAALRLNLDRERYCQLRADGKSSREAHDIVYGKKTLRHGGNEVDYSPVVRNRIEELIKLKGNVIATEKAKGIARAGVDKEWVMRELVKNVRRAKSEKKLEVVNRSLELIGKELGMFIDRSKLEIEKKQSLDEFLDTLDLPPSEFKRIEDKTLQ